MRITAATCAATNVGNGNFAAILRHIDAITCFKCQRFIAHNFLISSTCCAARCAIARRTCACMRHGHVKAIGFQLRHIHRIIVFHTSSHVAQGNRIACIRAHQVHGVAWCVAQRTRCIGVA